MGNWLKGRVLMLNDVSMIPDGTAQQGRQVTNQSHHDCQVRLSPLCVLLPSVSCHPSGMKRMKSN